MFVTLLFSQRKVDLEVPMELNIMHHLSMISANEKLSLLLLLILAEYRSLPYCGPKKFVKCVLRASGKCFLKE